MQAHQSSDKLIEAWKNALETEIIPGKREILQRFFKTGPGQYGEGDIFLGVTVPSVRKISKLISTDVSFDEISEMLHSPVHDHRLSALLVLVEHYRKARLDESLRHEIVDFYLNHTSGINNWDLVDLSAPKIIGEHIRTSGDYNLLYRMSLSNDLWEQRIAIVSTWTLLKYGITAPTIEIARRFLTHPHDLIHKASGWMLREMGKRGNLDLLIDFLDKHAAEMPRTMLRYAIEKLPASQRNYYLNLRSAVKQNK